VCCLLALTEPAVFIHEPFDLDRRDVGSQLKVSSDAGIELMKV
jgi:hypothetical protein